MLKQSTKAILIFIISIPAIGLLAALLIPQFVAIKDHRPILQVLRWSLGLGIIVLFIPPVWDLRKGIGSLFKRRDQRGWEKWCYRIGCVFIIGSLFVGIMLFKAKG